MNIKIQTQQWFTKFLYLKNSILNNRFFVFTKNHRIVSTVLFTVFALLLITPFTAYASVFDSIIISSTNWLLNIEFYLLERMTQGVSSLMKNTNVVNSDYITIPWKNVRDVANIGFIGVLLIISIMNIIGYQTETYSIQAALPKFIFAVIAVNFSKLMVGFILDAINILVATLFTFVGGPEMGTYGEKIAQMIASIYGETGINGGQIMDPNVIATTDGAIAQIFLIILLGIMVLGFGGLLVTYLVRMVWMWVLTVVSPMYFFGMSIGLLNRLQGLWWDKFVMWALMPLKVAAVMAVGFRIHNVLVQPGTVKAEFMDVLTLGTIGLGNANLQNTPQATVMGYILVAAITWTAFSFAKDQGAADKINDWYTAGIKKVGQGAGWLAYTTRLPGIRRDEEGKLKLVLGGSARARVESVKAVYDHIVKRKAEDRKRQVSEMVLGQYVPIISAVGGKKASESLQRAAEAGRRAQIKQDLEERHISDDQIPSEMRKYNKASERITVASTAKNVDSNILKTSLEGGIQNKEDIDLFAQTFGTKHPFGAFMKRLREDLEIKDTINPDGSVTKDPAKIKAEAIMAKMQSSEGITEVIKLMEGKTDVNIEGLDAHSINDKEMDSYREAMKNSLDNMDLGDKERDKFGYIDKDRKPRRGHDGEMERGEEDRTKARLQYLIEHPSDENNKELNNIMSRLTYDEKTAMQGKLEAGIPDSDPRKETIKKAMNYAMNNNNITSVAKDKNKLEMTNALAANPKILDTTDTRKAFINQGLGKEVLESQQNKPEIAQEILESNAFGNLDDATKQQVVQTVTLNVDTIGKIDKAGQIKNISTEQLANLANTNITSVRDLVIKHGEKLKDHLSNLDKDILKKIAEVEENKNQLIRLGIIPKE